MDIPLNAKVRCTDGVAGRSPCIILNPITQEITHFVLKSKGMLEHEKLVPISLITKSTPRTIHLRCTTHDLAKLEPFEKGEYIGFDGSDKYWPAAYNDADDSVLMWPYLHGLERHGMYINMEQIPHGELGIHRGAHVDATDGRVGRVDEFLVNPRNCHITHLVLRKGHLWGESDVTIPVSEIQHIENDTVRVKLSRDQIAMLPHIPVHR